MSKVLNTQSGFSLIEILAAIGIISVIFVNLPRDQFGGFRAQLDDSISYIDRALRFSSNEATLRNSMTRIHFNLDSDPIEMSVEYGSSANIILPSLKEEKKLNLREVEEQGKKLTHLSKQFQPVEEFTEEFKSFPESILVLGIATDYQKDIVTDGNPSLYFYPTGEKDNGVIFLSTPEEIVMVEVLPYLDEVKVQYYTFTEDELENLENAQIDKMQQMYDDWISK